MVDINAAITGLDFTELFGMPKRLFWGVMKIIFDIMGGIPYWFKVSFVTLMFCISLLLLFIIIKYRDERHRVFY